LIIVFERGRIKDFFVSILRKAQRPQRQLFEREARVVAFVVKRALEWPKEDFEHLQRQLSIKKKAESFK
jgi:hypothetical protein